MTGGGIVADWKVVAGDCVETMRSLPESSIDAIVCDPPYGLEFMGRSWDRLDGVGAYSSKAPERQDAPSDDPHHNRYATLPVYNSSANARCRKCNHWRFSGTPCTCAEPDFPSVKHAQAVAQQEWHLQWCIEALRVLKPGGYLLAFGGTRTYHRLACAVEDAGFEIRDSIASLHWVQAQGFPKSLDISKAIDAIDAIGPREERARKFTAWMRSTGITTRQINEITGSCMGTHYITDKEQPEVATEAMFARLRPHLPPVPDEIEALVRARTVESENLKRRPVVGHQQAAITPFRGVLGGNTGDTHTIPVTEAYTDAARQWSGWGSALKPSHEPIVVARKPLIGTLAANVLKHGTGGLNIDGCRVATSDGYEKAWDKPVSCSSANVVLGGLAGEGRKMVDLSENKPTGGRWPPNLVFTHLPGCRRAGEHKVTGNGHYPATRGASGYDGGLHGQSGLEEKHTGTESIAAWTCAPGCAVAAMDRQSGITSSSGGKFSGSNAMGQDSGWNAHQNRPVEIERPNDTGFISRMFPQFEYDHDDPFTAGFQYVPKPSTSEREAGCTDLTPGRWEEERDPDSAGANNPRSRSRKERANLHPTVKPIGIMRWLCRLVVPPGGTVLDPFAGSGTTGCAAMLEGFDFIGCEREPEYIAIAESRIAHWQAVAERQRGSGATATRPRATRPVEPSVGAPPTVDPTGPAPRPQSPVTGRRRRRVEEPPGLLFLPFGGVSS